MGTSKTKNKNNAHKERYKKMNWNLCNSEETAME